MCRVGNRRLSRPEPLRPELPISRHPRARASKEALITNRGHRHHVASGHDAGELCEANGAVSIRIHEVVERLDEGRREAAGQLQVLERGLQLGSRDAVVTILIDGPKGAVKACVLVGQLGAQCALRRTDCGDTAREEAVAPVSAERTLGSRHHAHGAVGVQEV